MKKTVIILSVLTMLIGACGQKTTQEFYDENFKWKITIPKNLKAVNVEKWAKNRERGLQATEDIYSEDVENMIPIFTFNDGRLNGFEALYKTFNPEIDGDFFENCQLIHGIMYEEFVKQMPDAVIDKETTIEQIDNLDFYVFKIKITLPNELPMNMFRYIRLFDKQEFSLGITYHDERIGQKILDAWRNSTFEK